MRSHVSCDDHTAKTNITATHLKDSQNDLLVVIYERINSKRERRTSATKGLLLRVGKADLCLSSKSVVPSDCPFGHGRMANRGGGKTKRRRRNDNNHPPANSSRNNNDCSYEALVQKYARPVPRRSLLKCCSESLPVVQEFSLSVFFVARYQLSARWEEIIINQQQQQRKDEQDIIETRLDWAHGCILAGFLLVIAFRFQKQETLMRGTRTKARHRLTDACLLGVLLRLLASVLRRLTASYSSDTVEALTMACMGLHLLSCDYTYTSGRPANHPVTALQEMNDKNRPPFQGGTVSLNASFLATVLCISRLESDLTSYFFCSLAVIFFGFYPQTRADLMLAYPPHQSGTFFTFKKLDDVPGIVA